MPILRTAEEVQADIATEFQAKLMVDDTSLPDPSALVEGWLNETCGVKFWLVTLYPEIFYFFAFHPNELANSDLSEYKTSKRYSYYCQGWLSPLRFHKINERSECCFLKGTRRPSQRIHNAPHKLRICLVKDSGKIVSTHCSCINHVAAALFRIEAASRLGLNNPSCTSKPCEWLPNNKAIQPTKIKDLKLERSDFGMKGKQKAALNPSPKIQSQAFNPISQNDYKLTLNDIATALKSACEDDDCILFPALPKAQSQPGNDAPEDDNTSLRPLDDQLANFTTSDDILKYFGDLTKDDIIAVESTTRGQSENPLWFSFWKHIIASSKAHDIKTRFETFKGGKF